MTRRERIALACGSIPLVTGLLIFGLWLITRRTALVQAGIYMLCIGPALFGVGAIPLIRDWWERRQSVETPHPRRSRATTMAVIVLLLNFPVACGITLTVVAIETSYVVIIHNESPRPLTDVRISGGGRDLTYGSLPPGEIARRTFWIGRDGELVFSATHGSTALVETVDDYVTGMLGGHKSVTVHEGGRVAVAISGHRMAGDQAPP